MDVDLWQRLVGHTIIEAVSLIKGGEVCLLITTQRTSSVNASWEQMKSAGEKMYLISTNNITNYVSKDLYDKFKIMDVLQEIKEDHENPTKSKKRKRAVILDKPPPM